MKKAANRIVITLLCFFILCQSASAATLLVPVGQIIGLELEDNSVSVAAFDEALGDVAKAAGLQVGDRITRVDDVTVRSAQDIRQALDQADGAVQLSVLRGGKVKTMKLTPQITSEGPRLGIYLKQGVTGVGTVTWYDPQTGKFGALGHGVNDSSGNLLQMKQGSVYEAHVQAVKQGKTGDPGQLIGILDSPQPIGRLEKNTLQGVFGVLDEPLTGEPLPVASADQIKTGDAQILSTVAGQQVQEYSVEIQKIYPTARDGGRNLLLKVTDPELLAATGGIVQGMSGSPICQDGRIVGAVTHVLVNDPTMGYGIFIENMLDAAA